MNHNKSTKNHCGFSLLELAIVLFILAILLSGILVPLAVRQEQTERNDTQLTLDKIQESLYGFVLRSGRLPCPDCRDDSGNCSGVVASEIDDGVEDRDAGNTCYEPQGYVPWRDLGVEPADSWGNRYTYRVDPGYADLDKATPSPGTCEPNMGNQNAYFTLCSVGNITVHNDIPDSDTAIAQNIPAIVISHGKNFIENDPSNYEMENINDDSDFIQRDFSQSEDEEFDDLMIWISPHNLRLKMVDAGLLP